MAKIYEDLIQGTPEWKKARAGIPTASNFNKILKPGRLEWSEQADMYENHCAVEILMGVPIEDFGGTAWVERGRELEPDAAKFYELQRGLDVRHVGFVTNDAGTFGASPDGLVEDVGGLELKCPKAATHFGYIVGKKDKKTGTWSEGGAYQSYKNQVQGNLLASEREWWDIMTYHPEIMSDKAIVRVYRDDPYLKLLSEMLDQFHYNVQEKLERFRKG